MTGEPFEGESVVPGAPEPSIDAPVVPEGESRVVPAEEQRLAPSAAEAPLGMPVAPAYELPTARQVVGRGLQLALDATRDVRRASLFTGLLLLAVTAPFLVLVIANLQRLGDAVGILTSPDATQADIEPYLGLLSEVYGTGVLAAIGAVSVVVDGSLTVAALMGARAVGRPLRLREALQRSRQAFWRYGGAAIIVGIVTGIAGAVVSRIVGVAGIGASLGSRLLASLIGTLVAAPFGYIVTGVVLGDVGAMTAVRRSLTLTRARPALALVIAAFAFLAQAIQLFGISAAAEVVGDLGGALHPDLDPTSGLGSVALLAIVAVGIVAYGSLVVTVGAIAVAPQVVAFLGLTHYAAGLDRARAPEPLEPPQGAPTTAGLEPPLGTPAIVASSRPIRTRWVTRPMLLLIGLSLLVMVAGILDGAAR